MSAQALPQHPVDAMKALGMAMSPDAEAAARAICDEPVKQPAGGGLSESFIALLKSGAERYPKPAGGGVRRAKTLERSQYGNTYGSLDLVLGTDGKHYLDMQDCMGEDLYGPLTEAQIAAFRTLCEVPHAPL